ncbi:uncharacterized protein EDB91DRAFT_1239713 [Suillus paluster]|uniref:uncharacterized protein n=1 Tax=Suillus paluster TaxID=48578 RepID=UPI001B86361A|nr:uncharacterized protein EDB91DRAFT_1239713 [Suillus paluster]KAG1725869.1 hypothetical protein EDB91DRAFT_1239713 [Suillus paluster]
MKEWISPIYTFFDPTPAIESIDSRRAHSFKCMAKGCKVGICHFLNKKDVRSMGNMQKHDKSCLGDDVLQAANEARNADKVQTKIVTGFLKDRSITTTFKQKGKGRAELVHWVAESLQPFDIVNDRGFQSLMKTGRPEYYIPSPSTVLCNVRLVFEYKGKLNFMTDGWSSPNHCALVAFSVHLEQKGIPLSLPLDIIEVLRVRYHFDLYLLSIQPLMNFLRL